MLTSAKYRLTKNLGSVDFFKVFREVSRVHQNAAKKHPPYTWETNFNDAADATPICNLDAMLRHTFKMCSEEYVDTESHLPHVWHIECRLQMFLTGLLRKNGEDTYRTVKIDPKMQEYSNPYCFIAPEFAFMCANVPEPNFTAMMIDYERFESMPEVVRNWSVKLYKYIDWYVSTFHNTNYDWNNDITKDTQIMSNLYLFIADTLIFSQTLLRMMGENKVSFNWGPEIDMALNS